MPATPFKPASPHTRKLGQAIRIVSYNILANKYAANHSSYCPPQFLDWSYRSPRILSELDRLQADVICLQEVEQPFFNHQLSDWAQQRGYTSIFQARRPVAGSEPAEGVSLHYKQATFKPLASSGMCFADAAECLPRQCCSAHAHNRLLQAVQQQRESFVMALLQHMPSRQPLLVCSAHLHWNPLLPDIKVAQAAILCDRIAAFLRAHQQVSGSSNSSDGDGGLDVPVAIGGDFNSLPRKYRSDAFDQIPAGVPWMQSGVYQLLQDGQLPPSHPHHPANRSCAACSRPRSRSRSRSPEQQQGKPQRGSPGRSVDEADEPAAGQQPQVQQTFTTAGLQLQSSYVAGAGREPSLTTKTATFCGTLDYVFLSRKHWQVSSTLQLPFVEPEQPGPPELVPNVAPAPNQHLPSDHFCIGCDAVLLAAGAARGAD